MPLAFFCTLFFRHRKKSVSAPWDGKSQFAPESARQAPPKGNFLGRGFSLRSKQGGFPLAPLHPLRIANRSNRAPHMAASPSPAPESARQAPGRHFLRQNCRSTTQAGGFPLAPCTPSGSRRTNGIKGFAPTDTPNGFPRGKQSARPSLSENPHRNIFPSGNPPSFPLGKPQLSPHCRTF